MDINKENVKKMESEYSDSILNNVAKAINDFQHIKWKIVRFTVNIEPKPSQRPRLCGRRIYVPGASRNTAFFHKYMMPELKDVWIDKPCIIDMDVFMKTPESFTKTQKMLAELKILRPWTHTGDIDNLMKSYMDMIQGNKKRGHVGIMSDDCLVIGTTSNKYYSVSPRVEITIKYMDRIPNNMYHMMKISDNPRTY